MKEFVVGKKYRCIYEGSKGLSGVIFKCVESEEDYTLLNNDTGSIFIHKQNICKEYSWQVEDFEEVKEVKTRTDFRVGDRVYCMKHGWGKVTDVSMGEQYPIYVQFCNGHKDSYTIEGMIHTSWINKTLFFAEPTITPDCLEKEEDTHIITIDGKEVRLSEESFQALKEQFK